MPINEYSHISFEADPVGSDFEIRYQFYEKLPGEHFDRQWRTQIDLDVVGTAYDSDRDYSPAAKRIEKGWSYVRSEWPPTWSEVERLMLEGVSEVGDSKRSKREDHSVATHRAYESSVQLPLAEVSTFMFSRPPGW